MEPSQLPEALFHGLKDIIIEFIKTDPLDKLEVILSVIALGLASVLAWMVFYFVVTVFYVALT